MGDLCRCGQRKLTSGIEQQQIACFKCGDGNTPLYCLNCANDLLQAKLTETEQKLRESEAACAAMREAIEFYANPARWFEITLTTDVNFPDLKLCEGDPAMVFSDGETQPWKKAQLGLSTDAGRSLLAELDEAKELLACESMSVTEYEKRREKWLSQWSENHL